MRNSRNARVFELGRTTEVMLGRKYFDLFEINCVFGPGYSVLPGPDDIDEV